MSLRRRVRIGALAGLAVIVLPLVVACSVEQTLQPPSCEDGGSGLIVAQSVPTASQIPCFGDLPSGWTFATVKVNERHTVVTLDSDRAGESAAVLRLEDECDTSGAVPAPSDLPPARRFDEIERIRPGLRAARYYVFAGGCVSWTFDFNSGSEATEAVAIGNTLVLFSRVDLNASVRETFIDEEL